MEVFKRLAATLLEKRYMNGRAKLGEAYVPTNLEHIANIVTHAIFIIPSVLGMLWMLQLSADALQYTTAVIYGLALFFLFSVSTSFHMISYTGRFRALKDFFHIGDRAVIYIFIAASYTPWLTLRHYEDGSHGTGMLYIVWSAAVMGIAYQYSFHEKYKWLETCLYIIIGLCPSVVVLSMKNCAGLYEMAAGGIVYMTGVVFFKCDGLIPFAHAIWHCFVFVGAVFHYAAVCKHLLGPHNQVA